MIFFIKVQFCVLYYNLDKSPPIECRDKKDHGLSLDFAFGDSGRFLKMLVTLQISTNMHNILDNAC